MTLPKSLANISARFNAMSLRERALLSLAMLVVLVLAWDRLLMGPLHERKQKLEAEIGESRSALLKISDAIEGRARDNPATVAMQRKHELTQSLSVIDAQLQSEAAGLIAPQNMLNALREVLANQKGLRLLSMRNLPVTSLVAAPVTDSSAGSAREVAANVPAQAGPYIHSLEMVVEGNYIDVLKYLESIESLKWRFYWQVLELKSREYPTNRVRIRLSTLSMDREWLGV